MNRLSEQSRRLLELAGPGPTLPEQTSADVLSAIERRAVAGDLPPVDVSVPAAAASSVKLWLVLGGFAAGVGATAAAWIGVRDGDPPPNPTPVLVSAPATVQDLPTPPVPPESALPEQVQSTQPPSKPPSQTARPRTPTKPSLEAELELLRRAKTASATGSHRVALRMLGEHARKFPRGQLAEAREVARVEALCLDGQVDQARQAARKFERRHRGSAYTARLRSACSRVDRNETDESRP